MNEFSSSSAAIFNQSLPGSLLPVHPKQQRLGGRAVGGSSGFDWESGAGGGYEKRVFLKL